MHGDLYSDPAQIGAVDVLLLPGVGAFGAGMERLRAKGLDVAIVKREFGR